MAKSRFCVVRKRGKGSHVVPFGEPGWAIVKQHGKKAPLSVFTKAARQRGYKVLFRRYDKGGTIVCYERR